MNLFHIGGLSVKTYNKSILQRINIMILIAILLTLIINCTNNNGKKMTMLDKDNLFAWCIVPYDSVKRSPMERANMLLELGIKSYAYDWRTEHLSVMDKELKVMKEKGIQLKGVWFWLSGNGKDYFDEQNEIILHNLKNQHINTDLWIGIPEEYFNDFDDSQKLNNSIKLIDYTYKRAKEIGCTISLYNHGGWFGNPQNQIKIIENLGYEDIGMIYNFHHAHDQIDYFQENIKIMKKYLRAVNINGMRVEGPKILTVGEGNKELFLIQILISSGYDGSIGILGHVENADVKVILENNLKGLERIKQTLILKETI